MGELIGIIVAAIVLTFLGWLFIYLPIMGFVYLFLGKYALGILYIIPLLCPIGYFLYRYLVIEPEKTRRAALCRMYDYPQRLNKKETVNHWYSVLKDVITIGLTTCSDPNKKSDLDQCQHIVNKMENDDIFDKFHRAFRLTGCHMKIKDSNGRTISKIV